MPLVRFYVSVVRIAIALAPIGQLKSWVGAAGFEPTTLYSQSNLETIDFIIEFNFMYPNCRIFQQPC